MYLNKFFPLLLSVLLLMTMPDASAQKNKSRSKAKTKGKTTVISDETRQQSAIFADALRDFYAGNYESAESGFRKVLARMPKTTPSISCWHAFAKKAKITVAPPTT